MRERVFWYDLVRASACVFVVLLHASATVLYRYGDIPADGWWLANAIDSAMRPAVPLFFMLSGALTLGAADRGDAGWRKLWSRISRLLWPLLFYSLLAVGYMVVADGQAPGLHNLPLWHQFYHLWFFYSMLGVVLIAAFIRPVAMPPGQAIFLLFGALVLLGGALDVFLGPTDISILSGLPVYLLYFLIGHYGAALDQATVKRWQWPALLSFLVASVALAAGTGLWSARANEFDGVFYGYQSLPVAVQALSLFIFLRAVAPVLERNSAVVPIVTGISGLSLGIYGLHPFVISILQETGVANRSQPVEMEILVRFVVAFGVSLTLTFLLRKTLDRKGRVT